MVDISNGNRYDEARMQALATGSYGGQAALVPLSTGDYEAVGASDTAETIGATGGAAGDFLSHLIVTPLTINAGAILLGLALCAPVWVGIGWLLFHGRQ